jgi:Arc-like DNA binding domain
MLCDPRMVPIWIHGGGDVITPAGGFFEMARKPDETINLRVRMPEALRKGLAEAAEKNQRSLNSEIVFRLGQSFGAEGTNYINQYEAAETEAKRLLEQVVKQLIEKGRGR